MFELVPELPEQPQPATRESEIRRAYDRGRGRWLLAFCAGALTGAGLGLLGYAIGVYWSR